MATGTFTYNALRTKTLKKHIKTRGKIVCHSNSTRAMNDSVGFARYCGILRWIGYLHPSHVNYARFKGFLPNVFDLFLRTYGTLLT